MVHIIPGTIHLSHSITINREVEQKMKRTLFLLLPCCVLLISGCAVKLPPVNTKLEGRAYDAMEACYRAQEAAKMDLSSFSPEQQIIASAVDGLKAAAGQRYDPCAGIVTYNVLVKTKAEEDTKRIAVAGKLGGQVVTGGTAAILGGQAASVLKAGYSAAGDKTSFGGDASVSDSYNTTTSTGTVESTEVVATPVEEEPEGVEEEPAADEE